MDTQNSYADTLKDIKQMMERSSRFISLSGLSGIAAGVCALIGAWFAHLSLKKHLASINIANQISLSKNHPHFSKESVTQNLLIIAALTLFSAILLAFIFTFLRSKKTATPLWGTTAKRLMINVSIPLIAGGIYLLKILDIGIVGLIAPGCLIFYGLALLNASKYTLKEIRYLGLSEIVLGLINILVIGKGLYFWAFGFGVLHIAYGFVMWWKYERN